MQENVKVKKSKLRKIFDVVSTIVIILYLVFAIVISVSIFSSMGSESGAPSLFGYSFLNVVTDSMEGDNPDSFNEGDLVICEESDHVFSLKEGEVIAFWSTIYNKENQEEEVDIIKIHRIIEVTPEGNYITCGDNSPDNDGDGMPDPDAKPVHPLSVLSVYTGNRLAGVGDVFDFLTGQNGILICFVIPMAIFFIWALFKFIKALVELKYSKAPADGELSDEQKQKAIEEYLAKQAAAKASEQATAENNENSDNSET